MDSSVDTVVPSLAGNTLWHIDQNAIVVYCPDTVPQEWRLRLYQLCFVVSPAQYEQYVAMRPSRIFALYALECRGRYVYFHPGKVTGWVDEVVGNHTRLLAPHERLSEIYATGHVHLEPVDVNRQDQP